MTLPLTPDTLRAAYDFLATTPPFNKWNLPDGEDVAFRVVRDKTLCAWHDMKRRRHTIAVSASSVGHTQTLMAAMAHEMIHMHEDRALRPRSNVEHSTAFRKLAARACDVHGFDRKWF